MLKEGEVSEDDRISQLRHKIQTQTQNARARSELALLLFHRTNEEEALEMARQAVRVQPGKPFGYVALSQILTDDKERMEHLQKAINICCYDNDEQRWMVQGVHLLVRKLVEPREIETRQGKTPSAAPAKRSQSNKRPLNITEQKLVEQIHKQLDKVWDGTTLQTNQVECLAQVEYRLGTFLRKIDPAQSRLFFQAAQRHSPKDSERHAMASFWLETLPTADSAVTTTATTSMTRCPAVYVTGLYSTFADRFDALLVDKLDYQTPIRMRQLLGNHKCFDRALDLGCGTGLSGLAFRDLCTHYLKGIDLSPEMIDKARNRGCYQELCIGDVEDIACCMGDSNNNVPFDLVFACDVFCYLGDLECVFRVVYQILNDSGGIFCCSVELLDDNDKEECHFQLQTCARFAHKQAYIHTLAKATGFEIMQEQICPLRKNQGSDVKGLLTVLKKETI